MNEQEIKQYYKAKHEDLTNWYYSHPDNYPGGKEAFDVEHANNWMIMETILVAEGYQQIPGPTLEELEERVKQLEDLVGKI